MKYFFIAGDKSGDNHAASLISALRQRDSTAQIVAYGGRAIHQSGARLLHDFTGKELMGFWEVVKNIRAISGLLSRCKKHIQQENPDVVVCVDYYGFNIRIARFCKRQGIKTAWYIAPKTWAWKSDRNKILQKHIDLLLVIFPFEEHYFRQHGIDTYYVGNPVANNRASKPQIPDNPIKVALLPGSRHQEVRRILPVFLAFAHKKKDWFFTIAAVSGLDRSLYAKASKLDNIEVMYDHTNDILAHSHLALVASGTATLETAYHQIPQIVCYKTDQFSYWLARIFLNIKWISLVNILADKTVVPELIQHRLSVENLDFYANQLLKSEIQENLKTEYDRIISLIGNQNAAIEAADRILELSSL